MSNNQDNSYSHSNAYASRSGRSVSSDAAYRVGPTPFPSIPMGTSSRRSSKSQRTTTASSTPHSDDDWPSAPNLFDVEYEDSLRMTEEQVNHTLNLQLTQKTIAMLAMIRGTTPDRLKVVVDDDDDGEQDPLNQSPVTDDDPDDGDIVTQRDFDDELNIAANEDDHDYLIGGDFVEIDVASQAPYGVYDDDADAEEDIFGMEI